MTLLSGEILKQANILFGEGGPVSEHKIINFLRERVPAHEVLNALEELRARVSFQITNQSEVKGPDPTALKEGPGVLADGVFTRNHPLPTELSLHPELPPEIEKAAAALVDGASATGDRIDGLLNVIEARHNELRAKGAKLKELTKKSADQFANEAKDFLASMHKLETALDNEAKRVNGD